MALQGINLPLAFTGQEAIFSRVNHIPQPLAVSEVVPGIDVPVPQ